MLSILLGAIRVIVPSFSMTLILTFKLFSFSSDQVLTGIDPTTRNKTISMLFLSPTMIEPLGYIVIITISVIWHDYTGVIQNLNLLLHILNAEYR